MCMVHPTSELLVKAISMSSVLHNHELKAYEPFSPYYAADQIQRTHPMLYGSLRVKNLSVSPLYPYVFALTKQWLHYSVHIWASIRFT